ncbi:hypothetical protein MSAS_46050 [Mycobacterium saskatchewanense]|uniref:Uncharacterized protein n=1 Tax=Mycobacterium saskatchewanense TaxID=220927 RepID=A0AAJ3NRA1_9MYCO|nr:hypothetical protein [Mycobacterium saskatchewanense]ORW71962.1 hypothetical protein AWC23_11930 [Mycobacterium saskatchewanense]BBX65431.1 hypothetical protein MSAS_46050 [Mycobacterium saskatchewanense]
MQANPQGVRAARARRYRGAAHLRERPRATGPYRRFSIRLYNHTGAVILSHHQRYTFTGTLEQCEEEYRRAQTHNLLAG